MTDTIVMPAARPKRISLRTVTAGVLGVVIGFVASDIIARIF